MRRTNDLFLSGLQNMQAIVGQPGREFNKTYFSLLGIKSGKLQDTLQFLSPVLYVANVFFSVIFVLVKFLSSFFVHLFKATSYPKGVDKIGLLFHYLLIDRMKVTGKYDDVKYWIVGPNINISQYNLKDKFLIDYRSSLTLVDVFRVLGRSIKTITYYITHFSGLCLIHRTWEYYEVYYALVKIAGESEVYFSNQSDKWAILFDNVSTGEKHLFQHGVALNWGTLPNKLNNVSVFYAISDKTWRDVYDNILSNRPRLEILPPTISLTLQPGCRFKVLIVSDISVFDCDLKTLEALKDEDIDVFWKRHPGFNNDSCYRNQQDNYDFVYLTGKVFPEVDFVISYFSTLAFEYMAHGIPVYLYTNKHDYDVQRMLEEYRKVRDEKQMEIIS